MVAKSGSSRNLALPDFEIRSPDQSPGGSGAPVALWQFWPNVGPGWPSAARFTASFRAVSGLRPVGWIRSRAVPYAALQTAAICGSDRYIFRPHRCDFRCLADRLLTALIEGCRFPVRMSFRGAVTCSFSVFSVGVAAWCSQFGVVFLAVVFAEAAAR